MGGKARLGVVGTVLTAAVVMGGWMLASGLAPRELGTGSRLFDQVLAHVATRYVDSLDIHRLYERAATGLLRELGDPHSAFLDSARMRRVQALTAGFRLGPAGTGLEIDVRDGHVNVVATASGTPAERAGLRAGDRVTAINGRPTRGWTLEETRRVLRGDAGTTVTLRVDRFGGVGSIEVTLLREAVLAHPVQRVMLLEDGIGYLSLRSFSDSAAIEVAAAVDSLHRRGMRALVLDLRNNPGGLLSQGTAVAGLFLDAGQTIVSLRGRGPEGRRDDRQYVDSTAQMWPDLRLAVLVDRGTASASEIVAGALQDHDRAVIVGVPSYGKGSAQSIFPFADGHGVKLTTARWYTPSGRSIDVEASLSAHASIADGDTVARPVFHTDSGRRVYGGGGIVPDVHTGDSVVPRVQRALILALGAAYPRYRAAVLAEARAIQSRVTDPLFVVTPQMRASVYARLTASGVEVPRQVYDEATDLVDQHLGREAVRLALGRAAETRRIVARDRVVQQALARLRGAQTTWEMLAPLQSP